MASPLHRSAPRIKRAEASTGDQTGRRRAEASTGDQTGHRFAPAATHLLAHSYGGYTTNLPLHDVLDHPALIAYEADGKPLEPDHGGPARLLVPHPYLWKSAKWIKRLEILEGDRPGFWELNGYQHRGNPWNQERYSVGEYVARTLRRQHESPGVTIGRARSCITR